MWNHFFKHIDIDPKNVHILDGNAVDLIRECDQYEVAIKEAGGIELFVGGIGPDGHIAFNEPGNEPSPIDGRESFSISLQDPVWSLARG